MKLVYVAGKFRDETPWDMEQNIRRAEEHALEIAKLGAVPVVVHSMFRYFDQSLPDRFWLDGTMDILRRCDALFLLPGWEDSQGSVAERMEAQRQNIPIFEHEETLLEWLEERSC